MLNTDWTEVEMIGLLVDSAASLGFGMCGSKSTGIVIRQIYPGGAAELDGRMRPGDHILCVQDFNVRGFGPDQVATILRHSIATTLQNAAVIQAEKSAQYNNNSLQGDQSKMDAEDVDLPLTSVPIRFIVARPAVGSPDDLRRLYAAQQPGSRSQLLVNTLSVVPTAELGEFLETWLHPPIIINEGLPHEVDKCGQCTDGCSASEVEPITVLVEQHSSNELDVVATPFPITGPRNPKSEGEFTDSNDVEPFPPLLADDEVRSAMKYQLLSNFTIGTEDQEAKPGFDTYLVQLERADDHNLGLTVAGYVYNDPSQGSTQSSGVFVHKVTPGGAAEMCRQIFSGDQIIQVNGDFLLGLDNFHSIALLKRAQNPVSLMIRRHTQGFLYEELRKIFGRNEFDQPTNVIPSLPPPLISDEERFATSSSVENFAPSTRTPWLTKKCSSINSPLLKEFEKNLDYTDYDSVESQIAAILNGGDVLATRNTRNHLMSMLRHEEKRCETLSSGTYNLSLMEYPGIGDICEEVHFVARPLQHRVNRKLTGNHVAPTKALWTASDSMYDGEVTLELEELMRKVWQPLISPHQDVIVLRIKKPRNVHSLGFSIEGIDEVPPAGDVRLAQNSSDVEPRHFVKTVVPGGLVSGLDIIQPGDELLQANGRRLRGSSRTNVVRCLRKLPTHIELVLARPRPGHQSAVPFPDSTDAVLLEDPPLEVLASEVNSVDSAYSGLQPAPSMSPAASHTRVSEWVRRSVAELSDSHPDAAHKPAASPSLRSSHPMDSMALTIDRRDWYRKRRARSSSSHDRLSPFRNSVGDYSTMGRPARMQLHDPRYGWRRPVWSSIPMLIQLVKTSEGFGFSVSEYEELTVTDIDAKRKRAAMTLGRRLKGSQLSGASNRRLRRSATLPSGAHPGKQCFLLVDSIVPDSLAAKDGRISVGDRLLFVNDRNLAKASLREAANALRTAPKGPCLLGIAKMYFKDNFSEPGLDSELPFDARSSVNDPAYGGYEPLYVNTLGPGLEMKPHSFTDENRSDHPLDFHRLPEVESSTACIHSPHLVVSPVDPAAEKTIRLPLHSLPIGIKLDALAAGGQDGCRIIQILDGGAVQRSGLLKRNDYITRLADQDMRRITNVEAFEALRMCSSSAGDVEVVFLPAHVVQTHRSKSRKVSLLNGYHPESRLPGSPVWQSSEEKVVLRRTPDESAWGVELIGKGFFKSSALLSGLEDIEDPTFIHSITPNSPAGRCGMLEPGDMILKVADQDVSMLGPDRTSAVFRNLIQSGVHDLILNVRFTTRSYPPMIDRVNELDVSINKLVVSAAVEPQRTVSNEANDSQGKPVANDFSPDSSHMDAPEPLSELELRDELNVLSRPTAERNTTDSGEDYPNLAAISGPVLTDEGSTFVPSPRASTNMGNLDEMLQSLPVFFGDPQTAYKRSSHPDDEVLTVPVFLDSTHQGASQRLGLRLVGSRMPGLLATYIFGFTPGSITAQSGNLRIGDEIVQVEQYNVTRTNHLLVRHCIAKTLSAVTSQLPASITFVVRRNPENFQLMSTPSSPEHTPPPSTRSFKPNGPIVNKESGEPVSPLCNGMWPNEDHSPSFMEQIAAFLEEPIENFDIFDLELFRNQDGYGIFIVNYGPDDNAGVFVSDLAPNGAASMQGKLRPHDRIVAVNGVPYNDYDTTLKLMKQSTESLKLTIVRHKLSTPSPIAASSPAPPPQPEEIVPGKETLIELIRRPNCPLGLSVVGGKGTALDDIVVHSIREEGLVASDGRLAVGDRLLAINGATLRGTDHETATELIRTATNPLRFLVYRDPPTKWLAADDTEHVEVVLKREPNQNLGISLVGRSPYSTGTAIAAITEGTPAYECGVLQPGDILVQINGLDVHLANVNEVMSIFKKPVNEFRVKVERPPTSTSGSCPPMYPSRRLDLYVVVLQRPMTSSAQSQVDSGPTRRLSAPLLGSSNAEASFGLFLRQATPDEVMDGGGQLIVDDILPGSPAALSIMIKPGDRLLTVDHESVDWLLPDEVFSVLSNLSECTLELGRLPSPPYLVDPGLSTACYPKSQAEADELPNMLLGDMPEIEAPLGFREMNALAEEPVGESPVNVIEPEETMVDHNHDSETDSVSSQTVQEAMEIAERAGKGFQVRHIEIPPATPGSTLGVRLRRNSGVSGTIVVRVKPGSAAEQADVRVGDRILGIDNRLIVSLGPDMHPEKLLSEIEQSWLSRTGEKRLSLTVISPTPLENHCNGIHPGSRPKLKKLGSTIIDDGDSNWVPT